MKTLPLVFAAAALSGSLASAQVTVIASESFDYTFPGLLQNAGGGAGWANAWDLPAGNGNEIVIFNQSVNPPMACPDNVGNYAGQASEFVAAARIPDQTGHSSVVESGLFGADGATIWISFRTVMYQQFGAGSFGALQLFDSNQPGNEQVLLGSPFASSNFNWGWDDEGGMGLPPEVDAATDAAVCARLVFRIDHMAGDERVRMWVDPVADFPTTETPNLDGVITDLRWDEIRINSGGSGTHFFWDDIVIARGEPDPNIGMNYCGPGNPNSTGASSEILAGGSPMASANDVTLVASNIPTNSFGFFLTSRTQGFTSMPGGSQGNLCLAGSIGRYVGPGQIQNSGQLGEFSLALDLTQTPTPTGFVTIQAGETWNFQGWHRDSVGGSATSNFTDG
ncbi:MAG: hypothetical protein AAGI22_27045, partial [Planctomycetota bacterium]